MPDPRQQDHKLNKDELVSYRYSVVLVEVEQRQRETVLSPVTYMHAFIEVPFTGLFSHSPTRLSNQQLC